MHAGARVGGRDAEDVGDLGVAEPRMELQGDELALARFQGGQRDAYGGAALSGLGLALWHRLVARGLDGELCAALAPAQLVERRVAGDPEEPRSLGPTARIERALLAEGALEGGRGDLLGSRAIAQQRGGIGVDGVRAGAVERLEGGGDGRGRLVDGHRQRVLHIGATAPSAIRHKSTETRGGPKVSSGCDPVARNARRDRPAHGRSSGLRRRAPGRPDPATASACGRRSTSATRSAIPTRSASAGRCPATATETEVMFMRFQVQLFDAADARWHTLAGRRLGLRRASARPARRASRATRSRSRRRARGPRPTFCAAWSPSSGATAARSCATRAGHHGGPPGHGRIGPGRLQFGNVHDHLTRCPPPPMNHP